LCAFATQWAFEKRLSLPRGSLANISLESKLGLRFNRRAMQTLGLSDSTPHTEGRWKSLFWPSIETPGDVDYLGAQGHWVCAIVALVSVVMLILRANSIIGPLVFLYYYIGGVGAAQVSPAWRHRVHETNFHLAP
jgi:hypothetical protein